MEWDVVGPGERVTTTTWQGHMWHFECAAMRSRAWVIHIGRDGGRQTLVLTKHGLLQRTDEGTDFHMDELVAQQGHVTDKRDDDGHFERADESEEADDEREDEREDEKEL